MSTPSWARAARILAIRLDTIGDVLMTGPAIRALAAGPARPDVTVLTSTRGAEAAALLPGVSEVIAYDPPWMKATANREDAGPDRGMIDLLRARRFEAAVIFTLHTQSALPAAMLCMLAEVPLRLAHCRENPYQLLTCWVRDDEPEAGIRHDVQRQLDLVCHAGFRAEGQRLEVSISAAAAESAAARLSAAGINPAGDYAVLHPGASAPSRRYPPESFARAGALIREATGLPFAVAGSATEQSVAERIACRIPGAVSVAGSLSLEELGALIRDARIVLSNNSAPAHLAAAVGTPVVDLYALTNPQHEPWQVPCRVLSYDVPCKFCYRSVCAEGHHDCLRRITPESVAEAALDLLIETAAPGRAEGAP